MSAEWVTFQVFDCLGSAEALRVQLEAEGVPARVQSTALLEGREGVFAVLVVQELAHRARWVVKQLQPTDSELTFLATGELPGSVGAE